MSKYEMVFLVAPDAPEEKQTEFCERLKGYVSQMNGTLESLELWEKRKLAYEIRKFREAFYYIFRFEGDGKLVDELERRMRVSDDVLRFLTVRKDEELKVEAKRRSYYEKRREQLDRRRKRETPSGDRPEGSHRERSRARVESEVTTHE